MSRLVSRAAPQFLIGIATAKGRCEDVKKDNGIFTFSPFSFVSFLHKSIGEKHNMKRSRKLFSTDLEIMKYPLLVVYLISSFKVSTSHKWVMLLYM